MPLVSPVGRVIAGDGRLELTDAYKQTKYCNPRCACVPRVNYCFVAWIFILCVIFSVLMLNQRSSVSNVMDGLTVSPAHFFCPGHVVCCFGFQSDTLCMYMYCTHTCMYIYIHPCIYGSCSGSEEVMLEARVCVCGDRSEETRSVCWQSV